LRFHDLRHTFGSLAITRANIVEVQAWMGHADIQTTIICTTGIAARPPSGWPTLFVWSPRPPAGRRLG
jgi:integrase